MALFYAAVKISEPENIPESLQHWPIDKCLKLSDSYVLMSVEKRNAEELKAASGYEVQVDEEGQPLLSPIDEAILVGKQMYAGVPLILFSKSQTISLLTCAVWRLFTGVYEDMDIFAQDLVTMGMTASDPADAQAQVNSMLLAA